MRARTNPAEFRIMLVDDDPTTLLTVSSILRSEGYPVVEFSDSTEANSHVGEPSYDILIADYKMPGVDGLSLLRRSKLLHPRAIRMMLTGMGDYEVAIGAINHGEVYRFMTKPVDELELRINVRLAAEHLALVREVEWLRAEVSKKDAVLDRLERANPGITAVERRADGSIVVDLDDDTV